MGSAFQNPTFDAFAEMLIFEQSKLIDMGLLTSSKTKALVASDENQSSKEEKVLTIARKSSGSKNHNLRHKNYPPHNKEIILPTRRETMKRRINFFVHIAKSQIMINIIARLKESMSWKTYSERTKFKCQVLPRIQLHPLQREKVKHLYGKLKFFYGMDS